MGYFDPKDPFAPEDGTMEVRRAEDGKVWISQWDDCAGSRGKYTVYRYITAEDEAAMQSKGYDPKDDSEVINWAIKQPGAGAVWGKYKKTATP